MTTLVPFEATYAGRGLSRKGGVVYRYLDSRDDAVYQWGKPLVSGGGTVGAVYEVNEIHDDDGQAHGIRIKGDGAPRYVRSLPYDDPRVIEWRAADEAVAVDRARQSAIRKAGDPFDEVVRLLAQSTHNLSNAQRRALAVRLMEALWL